MLLLKKKDNKLHQIKPKGLVLGWIKNIKCPSIVVELEAGDRIILYTDGIIEGRNADGEIYEDRFFELVTANKSLSAKAFIDFILEDLASWSKDQGKFDDDVMMVVVDVL